MEMSIKIKMKMMIIKKMMMKMMKIIKLMKKMNMKI